MNVALCTVVVFGIKASQAIRELDFKSWYVKPNLDCISNFTIDFALNRILFGAKSVGKVQL